MGKIANAFDVKNKRIAELEAELANSVQIDSADKAALDSVDDSGNPIPPSPPQPTADELAAELKTSADALNVAVENQQQT